VAPDTNPWRPGDAIRFGLSTGGAAQITLYDARGRLVRSLLSGPLPAGERQVAWDGRDDRGRAVVPGLYFVRLSTPQGSATHKLAVLRRAD